MTQSTGQRYRASPEIKSEIIRQKKEGKTAKEIAVTLGLTVSQVNKLSTRNGAKLSKEARRENIHKGRLTHDYTPVSQETINKIKQLKDSNCSEKSIATILGLHENKVRTICSDNGFYLSKQGQSEVRRIYSDELRKIITDYRKQKNTPSYYEIAMLTGQSEDTVEYICRNEGVLLDKTQLSAILVDDNREEINTAIRLLRDTNKPLTIPEISKETGYSLGQIKWSLSTQGITLSQSQKDHVFLPCSRTTLDAIANMRLVDKKSCQEIADFFGIDKGVVTRECVKREILLDEEARKNNMQRDSKYTWGDIRQSAKNKEFLLVGERIDTDRVPSMSERVELRCFCGSLFTAVLWEIAYERAQSCGCEQSREERNIAKLLQDLGYNVQKTRSVLDNGKELDIYIPEQNVAIEYCGLYWHSDAKPNAKNRHLDKLKSAEAKGIRLITIFADEWLTKREQVIGYIKAILKHKDIKRIGARDGIVKPGDPAKVSEFIKENHIQSIDIVRNPYVLEVDGEIIAAMTFSPSSPERKGYSVPGFWELNRYCVKIGYAVTGGFDRLMSNFVKNNNVTDIVSFSDKRWSQGNMYKNANFVLTDTSLPDYSYVKSGSDTFRKHKSKYRKEKIGCPDGMTETEATQIMGLNRIWDCGKDRWLWKKTI